MKKKPNILQIMLFVLTVALFIASQWYCYQRMQYLNKMEEFFKLPVDYWFLHFTNAALTFFAFILMLATFAPLLKKPNKKSAIKKSLYTVSSTVPLVHSEDNSEKTDVDVECALGNASQEINIIGSI